VQGVVEGTPSVQFAVAVGKHPGELRVSDHGLAGYEDRVHDRPLRLHANLMCLAQSR
jgi:hypothetical protein